MSPTKSQLSALLAAHDAEVRAEEREWCAKMAEELANVSRLPSMERARKELLRLAAAIRAPSGPDAAPATKSGIIHGDGSIADVGCATGRLYLSVAGLAVAVEGDACREGELGGGPWDKPKLRAAADRINAAVRPAAPSDRAAVRAEAFEEAALVCDRRASREEADAQNVRDMNRIIDAGRAEQLEERAAVVREVAAAIRAAAKEEQ